MVLSSISLVGRHQEVLARLGDGEPTTPLEAEAIIESIRLSKGYLDEDVRSDLDNLLPRNRDIMLQFVQRQRETEAAYTKSISEQLYSSKYRFLYEIIQNADDSSYSTVGQEPTLQFSITPDTIIIQTNEDGFTRANVEAICATGKSSKKGSALDDHIGKKGFGFKSVFAIANEVRIQSGLWSFQFLHNPQDDGLGMVTPLQSSPEILPLGVTTRIVLKLSDKTTSGYQKLLDAVSDVPDTTILFLQQLQHVVVDMRTVVGSSENIIISRKREMASNLRQITRSRAIDGKEEQEVSAYFEYTHTLPSMPRDDRRKDKASVKIDLAFPVDPSTMKPKLSTRGQHVFAYLPLQRLPQIQFLIQSDFITSANRESVMDCPWNEAICNRVARLFQIVVSDRFNKEEHPLMHSWLEYLPTGPMEHPWKSLNSQITDHLKAAPCLQSWEGRHLMLPGKLRQISSSMLYQGQPLFKDLANEIYLAPEYDEKFSNILNDLGAITITWTEIIDRLQADLVSSESRMKTKSADDPWHEYVAQLTLSGLRLSAGGSKWTGAPGIQGGLSDIYFPTLMSVPVPASLPLHLVDPVAASNSVRKQLYSEMGVRFCPKKIVLAKIQEAHEPIIGSPGTDILEQLRYLFHYHPNPAQIMRWVKIPVISGMTRKGGSTSLYFPSEKEYHMYQLLPDHMRQDPNSDAQFLTKELVNLEPESVRARQISWRKWLALITNAQFRPSLLKIASSSLFNGITYTLSSEMQTILEENPCKFLGTLKAHWAAYRRQVEHINIELQFTSVPCVSGNLTAICKTYLPSPQILSTITRLSVSKSEFAVLSLPDDELDEATSKEWQFLEEFGVLSKPDIRFYKTALRAMMSSPRLGKWGKIKEVYTFMARHVTIEEHEDLRSFFEVESALWDPHHDRWFKPAQCIWQGPDFMISKAILAPSYEDNILLKEFFSVVLRIANWKTEDILDEIVSWQQTTSSDTDVSLTQELYLFLYANVRSDEGWKLIRTRFSKEKLILGKNGDWHTSKTCVWRSPFTLNSFLDLSNIYPDLEDFFVRRLGLSKASPSMLIDEVNRMAQEPQPNIVHIRLRLVEIGMMLTRSSIDAKAARALDALKETQFLPKKLADGTSTLVQISDEFAIDDHLRYGRQFAEHGVLLDFSVSEVQSLHVVFQYFGMTDRYLSTMVQEVSTIGDDSSEDKYLSQELQAKAYALYCCAAKYKSWKALRGDHALFNQLASAIIHTTNDISTHIVLPFKNGSKRIQSDRSYIHHGIVDEQLKIYIPAEERQRLACYRSQLPGLLASIMGTSSNATFNISSIVASPLQDLDEILVEQDIPAVDWIEKPVITIPEVTENERPETPTMSNSVFGDSESTTIVRTHSGLFTPWTPTRQQHHAQPIPSQAHTAVPIQTPSPAQYPRLIEQVIQSAQRASYRQRGTAIPLSLTPPPDDEVGYFDHVATFGSRDMNEFAHDRKIGAAGEAFVFETLSALSLPAFTRDNWRSTIRGELASTPHYATMQNWVGRETADIVYTDRTGALTRYLRDNCVGEFPAQIRAEHDHAASPIEYFLEVKSSVGACGTRFFLSSGQFQRMETMALREDEQPTKVYVIMRVFDLTTPNVGMKIFVDPLRLVPEYMEFEAQGWIGRTR